MCYILFMPWQKYDNFLPCCWMHCLYLSMEADKIHQILKRLNIFSNTKAKPWNSHNSLCTTNNWASHFKFHLSKLLNLPQMPTSWQSAGEIHRYTLSWSSIISPCSLDHCISVTWPSCLPSIRVSLIISCSASSLLFWTETIFERLYFLL